MNEELQSKLVEVLTGISEGVAQAKDFAVMAVMGWLPGGGV